MNAVIDPNEKQSVICERKQFNYDLKRMGAVESDRVKSARKAKDKLLKAYERASETRERTLHEQEQNRMRMPSMRVTRQCSVSNHAHKYSSAPRV